MAVRRGVSHVLRLVALGVLFCVSAADLSAHHADHVLSLPSPRCGWIDGEDVRDRRNLTDFCARWVPAALRISSASATRERLWIETPPDVAATLRDDSRRIATLLRSWVEHWRTTTGYRTASVILVRNHIEFARIQTTMTGDVVIVR